MSAITTTVVVDGDLFAEVLRLSGLEHKFDVMWEALKALIERESARRLARLGGSEPDLVAPPRRSEPA